MPRANSSEETRKSLIQIGIDKFSVVGYHGTGIKEILDTVHVPKGSFYNYFPSKEAYVAEVVDEFGKQMLEDWDESINESSLGTLETLREILYKSIDHYESMGCERGCLIGSLAAEIGGTSELCKNALERAAVQWEKRLAELLSEGQRAGDIRKDLSADKLATLFWSCWEGALMRLKLERQANPAREIADMLIDSILRPKQG